MTELTMPRLSDSMQEGTILSWLKGDGDYVETGDELLEIETDKATMTYVAEASGFLQIIAREGESLDVGAPIARLASSAQAAPEPAPVESGPEPVERPPASIEPPRASVGEPGSDNGSATTTTVKATPLARRAAAAHGVALADVTGTGPLGRVTRADVLAKAGIGAEPRAVPAPAFTHGPTSRAPGDSEIEVVEPSRLQAVVAKRMAEAASTIPHFQVQTEVEMDGAIALREELRRILDQPPSLNDLIVKAAALALREHRRANGAYRDGRFELYARVNIGIAVAADNALVVPTIFDADQKSLSAIAAEARTLAERVRERTITPAELSGATFTVSNLGMYGMTAITPLINPPQAAILGVGAVREVVRRVEGDLVDRRLLTLTLSCDHRILYGADAALFLSAIRQLLEQPLRLVL